MTDQPRCRKCGAFTTEVMAEAGQSGRILVEYCMKCDPSNRSADTEGTDA